MQSSIELVRANGFCKQLDAKLHRVLWLYVSMFMFRDSN